MKYICIHGHFYQPPRENPYTNRIDDQKSAKPYVNWNERITDECYTPNAQLGNYAHINFNFGPTLMSWLKDFSTDTYQTILKADHASCEKNEGHGNAIAQGYHHIILPLANKRDKQTQIYWGIEDFKHRFNRVPEGMWLPETAVDTQTLEVLSEQGITYTILSPYQASRTRKIGSHKWKDARDGNIDPSRAYICHLPSGRSIHLFFYDGGLANELAFGTLLNTGEGFIERIYEIADELDDKTLLHTATDGETYGHHQKPGAESLDYFNIHFEDHAQSLELINYAAYLAQNTPQYEVMIGENTSWSCSHGVERWQSDCGCKIHTQIESSQEWRVHLREALDWLRNTIAPYYESEMKQYFDHPWEVRDQYIHVLLNEESEAEIFNAHARADLEEDDLVKINQLLEMQKLLMMMYTSCGWFFDDIAGIETVQILQYAFKAIHDYHQLSGNLVEAEFMDILEKAHSNNPKYSSGKEVYEKLVRQKLKMYLAHE